MARTLSGSKRESGAKLGFEATLWHSADTLRNTMDAADPKRVVSGPIFLKYISDTFAAHRAKPVAWSA